MPTTQQQIISKPALSNVLSSFPTKHNKPATVASITTMDNKEDCTEDCTEITPISMTLKEASMLNLFLRRLTFDHFLSCSDGGNNEDQAYAMQASAKKLREELHDFIDQFIPF